jgi:sterol desaturase/sphingolipid hydroxylase (fatty acid hydroxylase superfamily)
MWCIRWLVALSTSPRQFGPSIATSFVVSAGFGYLVGPWSNTTALVIALGGVSYTFAEYAYHRWIAHEWMAVHGVSANHHDDPLDLFAAPWCAVPVVAFGLYLGISLALGLSHAAAFMLGVSFMHLRQEILHWTFHKRPPWCNALAEHHWLHHEDGTVNFGVSTTVWDRLFRTKCDYMPRMRSDDANP